jgi:hypothetical protein
MNEKRLKQSIIKNDVTNFLRSKHSGTKKQVLYAISSFILSLFVQCLLKVNMFLCRKYPLAYLEVVPMHFYDIPAFITITMVDIIHLLFKNKTIRRLDCDTVL